MTVEEIDAFSLLVSLDVGSQGRRPNQLTRRLHQPRDQLPVLTRNILRDSDLTQSIANHSVSVENRILIFPEVNTKGKTYEKKQRTVKIKI